MMKIELCYFFVFGEQAVKLHWSSTLIKSSQQCLMAIFEEYLGFQQEDHTQTGLLDSC